MLSRQNVIQAKCYLGELELGESVLGESLLGELELGESVLGELELGESVLGELVLGKMLLSRKHLLHNNFLKRIYPSTVCSISNSLRTDPHGYNSATKQGAISLTIDVNTDTGNQIDQYQ